MLSVNLISELESEKKIETDAGEQSSAVGYKINERWQCLVIG